MPPEHALVWGGVKNRHHKAASATTPLNLLKSLGNIYVREQNMTPEERASPYYQGPFFSINKKGAVGPVWKNLALVMVRIPTLY